jgi:hypothetical protein
VAGSYYNNVVLFLLKHGGVAMARNGELRALLNSGLAGR